VFGCHLEKYPNRFQRLSKTHPKMHDYCINKLGLKEVLDYIKVPYTDRQISIETTYSKEEYSIDFV